MAGQPIKYNAGSKTTNCCIRRNNFDIGINPDYQYGPTSSTDFWAGYDIPGGGFVTYQNKVSQGPSIYEIPSYNELVDYGNNLNIGNITSPQYVVRAANAVSGSVLINVNYPLIPDINGNILTLDAGYAPSYGWGGAEWFDIAGGTVTKADITGTTTFVTGTTGNNYFDGYFLMPAGSQNSWVLAAPFASELQTFTINVWAYLENSGGYSKNQNLVGQRYSDASNYAALDNCNFLIRGNGVNGFEGVIRLGGTDYIVDFEATATGGWRSFTLTYDGVQLRSYQQGAFKNFTIGPGFPLVSNAMKTLIGGTVNNIPNSGGPDTNYFDGRIAVVNIYDTVLDDQQVQDLHNAYTVKGL
jgi:hypothetical protein